VEQYYIQQSIVSRKIWEGGLQELIESKPKNQQFAFSDAEVKKFVIPAFKNGVIYNTSLFKKWVDCIGPDHSKLPPNRINSTINAIKIDISDSHVYFSADCLTRNQLWRHSQIDLSLIFGNEDGKFKFGSNSFQKSGELSSFTITGTQLTASLLNRENKLSFPPDTIDLADYLDNIDGTIRARMVTIRTENPHKYFGLDKDNYIVLVDKPVRWKIESRGDTASFQCLDCPSSEKYYLTYRSISGCAKIDTSEFYWYIKGGYANENHTYLWSDYSNNYLGVDSSGYLYVLKKYQEKDSKFVITYV